MSIQAPRFALTWADIEALPPGARRDELAYAYQKQIRDRYEAASEAISESFLVAEAAKAILERLEPDPPAKIQARRKVWLKASREWVDPRTRKARQEAAAAELKAALR